MSAHNTIAIIGGAGAMGGGLASAFLRAGRSVVIGSRDRARANAAASALAADTAHADVTGLSNLDAAKSAPEIVVLTVPYANHLNVLREIQPGLDNKILIDATVPLRPPKVARVQLPEKGSAAVEAQAFLGASVRVVSAFQNVSAEKLKTGAPNCDVLVAGDDVDARERVIALAQEAGMAAWHAGPLDNSAAAEALTSVLIHINKRYGATAGAGIRIVLD